MDGNPVCMFNPQWVIVLSCLLLCAARDGQQDNEQSHPVGRRWETSATSGHPQVGLVCPACQQAGLSLPPGHPQQSQVIPHLLWLPVRSYKHRPVGDQGPEDTAVPGPPPNSVGVYWSPPRVPGAQQEEHACQAPTCIVSKDSGHLLPKEAKHSRKAWKSVGARPREKYRTWCSDGNCGEWPDAARICGHHCCGVHSWPVQNQTHFQSTVTDNLYSGWGYYQFCLHFVGGNLHWRLWAQVRDKAYLNQTAAAGCSLVYTIFVSCIWFCYFLQSSVITVS